MPTTTLKCPNCNAELKWSPKAQNFTCEFCDNQFTEADLASEAKAVESKPEAQNCSEGDGNSYICKCSYCGAQVIAEKNDAATFCLFCRRPVTIEQNISNDFKPDFVIPFKMDETDAKNALKAYAAKRKFIPSSFGESIDNIRGVYIPYWLYNFSVDFDFTAECTTTQTWSDSTYNYTKVDTYSVQRKGILPFEMLPVDASSKADDSLMQCIEPFCYEEMIPFSKNFLSGFLAQSYDETEDTCYQKAQRKIEAALYDTVKRTISGYSSQQFTHTDYNFFDKTSHYTLFPVWFLTIGFKENDYQFAMNGQSGKFVGNLPIDFKKLWKFAGILFGSSTLVAFVLSFLGFWFF